MRFYDVHVIVYNRTLEFVIEELLAGRGVRKPLGEGFF
jgi:hypothetical protein